MLGVCVNLLELWQGEEELVFCGDVVKYGIIHGEFLNTLSYDYTTLETWEADEESIQSPSHFEKQFQEFTLLVFYTICRNFPQLHQNEILSFGTKEASWSSKGKAPIGVEKILAESIIDLMNLAKEMKISSVITDQIIQGTFRETVRFLIQQIAGTPEYCITDTGLKLKMNVTTLLHSISQNRILSNYHDFVQ